MQPQTLGSSTGVFVFSNGQADVTLWASRCLGQFSTMHKAQSWGLIWLDRWVPHFPLWVYVRSSVFLPRVCVCVKESNTKQTWNVLASAFSTSNTVKSEIRVYFRPRGLEVRRPVWIITVVIVVKYRSPILICQDSKLLKAPHYRCAGLKSTLNWASSCRRASMFSCCVLMSLPVLADRQGGCGFQRWWSCDFRWDRFNIKVSCLTSIIETQSCAQTPEQE